MTVQLIVVCLSGSALYYYNYVCTQLVIEVFVHEISLTTSHAVYRPPMIRYHVIWKGSMVYIRVQACDFSLVSSM